MSFGRACLSRLSMLYACLSGSAEHVACMQALTIQLEQLQRGKLGGLARPAAEEDDDLDDEDDLSDDDV